MKDRPVVIQGVGFLVMGHRDGRFVRSGGLFAFARRDPDGGRTLFNLDLADAIDRVALPDHPAFDYGVSRGLNELLVHLAGSQARPDEIEPGCDYPEIRWDLAPQPGEEAIGGLVPGAVGDEAA